MAIDCSGNILVAGFQETLKVWDLQRGGNSRKPVATGKEFSDEITASCVRAGEVPLVGVGDAAGKVRLFELQSEELVEKAKWWTGGETRSLRFDPSGTHVVTLQTDGGGRVDRIESVFTTEENHSPDAIYEFPSRNVRKVDWVQRSKSPMLVMVHSGDAKTGGSITVLEIKGQPKQLFRTAMTDPGVEIESLHAAWRNGVLEVVAGDESGNVIFAEEGAVDTVRLSTQAIAAVDVSEEGNWIAAGAYDGSLSFIHRSTKGEMLARVSDLSANYQIDEVKIDEHDGWVYAGCSDGAIRVWSLPHLKLLALTQKQTVTPKPKRDKKRSRNDLI